jgi:hypothetical protein
MTNQDVTVSATFSNDSAKQEYSFDGQNWFDYTEGIKVSQNCTVYFRGTDEAGNQSAISSWEVNNIDRLPTDKPVVFADITTPTNGKVCVGANFSDDTAVKEYSLNGVDWLTYTEPVAFEDITLKKWRKATSAEAIIEKGYSQAVTMTTDAMLKDVQKGIRKNFFDFLATGTGVATGTTFQGTLAQIWGQLQILFEDDEIGAVYFMNPLDVADYLATANITLQSAFGMTYVENFLGLGTVIFNSSVPKGKVYATAKDNIVCYYVPVNGGDLGEAFAFTSDETGLIGIHEEPDYTNLTASDTVVNGMVLFAERLDGVVVGTIGA